MKPLFVAAALCVAGAPWMTAQQAPDPFRQVAEAYVRLVLAVGQHDADYVDAYYGPPQYRTEAAAAKLSLADIATRGAALDRRGREDRAADVEGGCRAVASAEAVFRAASVGAAGAGSRCCRASG